MSTAPEHVLDPTEVLHLAACAYATRRIEELIAKRKAEYQRPKKIEPNGTLWVAHYEGYIAGWKARS